MSGSISFTVRPPSAPHRPSTLGNRGSRHGPPSSRLFQDQDEDDEDDGYRRREDRSRKPRDERVEGISNGRTHGETPQGPLVIPALPNRDWRAESRRTPTYRPESRQQGEVITHERTGDGPQRSGIRKLVKEEVKVDADSVEVKREVEVDMKPSVSVDQEEPVKAEPTTPLTLEQQALQAILAGQNGEEEEDVGRDLVIDMQTAAPTEEDAYKRDMEALPEESTLDDYDAIPVSAFGLAMARGMGYDPKSSANTTVHQPKMRPQLLGLGATPMDPSVRPTHSKSGGKKDRQAERNAKSGRGFVATNLLVKKEREGSSGTGTPVTSRGGSPDSESRRRRRDDDDYGRDSKRERNGDDYRDRRREREYETEEERARRKAREKEREFETEEERARRKAREREREYETDEERARRKAKERERERERERDRDRDSRRYDDRERGDRRRYDDYDRDRRR